MQKERGEKKKICNLDIASEGCQYHAKERKKRTKARAVEKRRGAHVNESTFSSVAKSGSVVCT